MNPICLMDSKSLPTEIILSKSNQCLGKIHLDWTPQPGNYVELGNKTYVVLERRHHYQYKIQGYCLQKISLQVQESSKPPEQTLINGRWIIGDSSCKYNAHSPILRCTVNPQGLCDGCNYYESESE